MVNKDEFVKFGRSHLSIIHYMSYDVHVFDTCYRKYSHICGTLCGTLLINLPILLPFSLSLHLLHTPQGQLGVLVVGLG